ncbi:uncharacterized protein V6R79_000932 [Siganus canaliculatus]
MALTCNQCFQPHLLALVLIMVPQCFVAGTAPLIHLKGEVGGNVTFHCRSAKDRTVKFLYFQKGDIFVNGYHATKEVNNTWNNTRVDRNASTVHMENLNISHAGDYQCYILYTDSGITVDTSLHLDVTGTYSKPEVKVNCSGTSSCKVTCVSHGGYPGTDVIWNDPGNPMRNFTNTTNSRMSDPRTKLVNSSSTASFSCTKGELKLTCSVGGITSDMFSVYHRGLTGALQFLSHLSCCSGRCRRCYSCCTGAVEGYPEEDTWR